MSSSSNALNLPRTLVVFGICLPLALYIGYLLASPDEYRTVTVVGLIVVVLSIPLLLKWHYPILLFSWSANMMVFFLPGQPPLWILMACVSLSFTVLACIMDKQKVFQNTPRITLPLLFLLLVVLVTAKLTGGIGLRSLGGSTFGGKKLIFIIAAIIGYYAISSQRIPINLATRLTGLFFLSAITGIVSNLAYLAGEKFYLLYYVFPVENALSQAMEATSGAVSEPHFGRIPGVTAAAMATCFFVLARYGIRGIFVFIKPYRYLLLFSCVALSLLGGFRSALVVLGLICAAQFYFEGLFRTRFFVALIVCLLLGGAFLATFSDKMPLSVQRSLTIVPFLELDPIAKQNAQASLDWRWQMWQVLLPQVREYFFLGKGYALSPADIYLTEQSVLRGLAKDFEPFMATGDYHSGPLSIMIPFGIFGLLGFLWLLFAGGRILYLNYRYGDTALRNINTFLLSYYLARAFFFFVGFGAFSNDLALFLGVIGLSIALNWGVRNKNSLPQPSPSIPEA